VVTCGVISAVVVVVRNEGRDRGERLALGGSKDDLIEWLQGDDEAAAGS
jgi:hypothetical protein